MVDVVNKQPVIKKLNLKLLKTIVLRIWWKYENMASESAHWRWTLLKLNPSKFQKVTKYALFYSSVNIKISR